MTRISLPGLRYDMPVGFMAGLGLIRISPQRARLSWNPETFCAELHGVDREELLDHMLLHMTGRSQSRELHLRDDVRKLDVDTYRGWVTSESDETLAWVRALWREDGDTMTPTNFCFTSGQQRMILMAQELAQALDPSPSPKARARVLQKFEEALFGPWLYADNSSSWGWDPATYRIGAQTPEAPAKMSTEGVAAAYWLAWEALPLIPCIPGQGTLGFVKENRITKWTWASWSEPLARDAVEAVLRRPSEALALGGRAMEADVVKPMSSYYQFFRPGRPRSV